MTVVVVGGDVLVVRKRWRPRRRSRPMCGSVVLPLLPDALYYITLYELVEL